MNKQEKIDAAEKAFDEATALAGKEFSHAVDRARKAYEEAATQIEAEEAS